MQNKTEDKNETRKLIFVYGTLCQGFGNHRVIQHETTKYLGEATSPAAYTLYDGGFPITERGGEVAIKGEVYEVNDKETLLDVYALEHYSGTPTKDGGKNWYDVDKIPTEWGVAEMFVQAKGQSGRTLTVESGDWRNSREDWKKRFQ